MTDTCRQLKGISFHKKIKRAQSGFTLLEVIVSLAILSAATVGLVNLASRYAEDTLNSVTASQIRTFGLASNAYIKENYAAVQAIATPTAPAMVSTATLIAAGKLPAGYAAITPSGKTLCTLVIEPTANRLQAMVVAEGGTATNDLDLGSIASTIGGSGGGVYSLATTIIRGAVGGWSVPSATFDNLVNNAGTNCAGAAGNVRIVTGTPVMALWFENGDVNAAFLSRDSVPGRPELNVMNAPLVLDSIQTAGAVCTRLGSVGRDATGALLACQGGVWRTQGSSFWQDAVPTFASLPSCTATISGQTRVVTTPSVGTGPRAYNCNGTAWLALATDDSGNFTAPGNVSAGKVQLTDTVAKGAACGTTGQMARRSTGEILSCQGGIWAPQGGKFSLSTLFAQTPVNQSVGGCYASPGYFTVTKAGWYGMEVSANAFVYSGTYNNLGVYVVTPAGAGLCYASASLPLAPYNTGYLSPNAYCIEHLDPGVHAIYVSGSDASYCATSYINTIFGGQVSARLLSED